MSATPTSAEQNVLDAVALASKLSPGVFTFRPLAMLRDFEDPENAPAENIWQIFDAVAEKHLALEQEENLCADPAAAGPRFRDF